MDVIIQTHTIGNLCKYLDFSCIFVSLNGVSKSINEIIKNNVPLIERLSRIQDKIIFTQEIHFLKKLYNIDNNDETNDKLNAAVNDKKNEDFLEFINNKKNRKQKLLSYFSHCLIHNKPYLIQDNISTILERWTLSEDGEKIKVISHFSVYTEIAILKLTNLLEKKKNIQYN